MTSENIPAYRRFFKKAGLGADIGLTVALQVVGALLAYTINIVIARSLGKSGWDDYSLCMHTYILIGTAVMDFGIIAVAMPRIAAARGKFSPAFSAALRLRFVTFFLGLAAALSMALIFGDGELLVPVLIGFGGALVSAKFTGIRQVPEVMWRIRGRTWIISVIAIFDAVLLLGIILILANQGMLTITTVMIALIAANVPGFLLVAVPIIRSFRRSELFGRTIPKKYYRGMVFGALPIAVMALSSQLFARIEPLVINATIGREYVGEYIAGILPLSGTIFFAITIGVGMLPLISQIHRRARSDVSAGWVVSVGSRTLGGVAIFISAVCFLFAEDILWLFDPDYVSYAYVLRIYSITNGLEYLVVFFDQTLLAVDSRKEVMIGTLLSVVLALVLQLAAIPLWGIHGLLIAKIVAVVAKIIYQLVVLGKDIRVGALKAFYRLSYGIVSLIGVLFLTSSMPIVPRTLVTLVVVCAVLVLGRIVDLKALSRLRRLQLT